MKLSSSNKINLDIIDTGVLLKDLAQHLKRKVVAIADKYFTLPDAVSITHVVVTSHAEAKGRRD